MASKIPPSFPPSDWNPEIERARRVQARNLALNASDTFIARCARHQLTLFDTISGACLSCIAEPSDLPVRVHYLRAYAISYPTPCAVHGGAQHDMRTNRCLLCYTVSGRPRAAGGRGDPVRVAARRSGATSYLAVCAIHGEVPHHTVRGRCLRCFNSLGYPRAAQTAPVDGVPRRTVHIGA